MEFDAGEKPCILILQRYFLPGFRAGGPIRSIANICAVLGNEYTFRVVCLDHDFQQMDPYPGIRSDEWNPVRGAQVRYLRGVDLRVGTITRVISGIRHDALYLNSFFDPHFAIIPLALRRTGSIPNVPILVAPRGEFSPGALKLKGAKKELYRTTSRWLGFYRDVRWHATSSDELELITRRIRPCPDNIFVARNLSVSEPPSGAVKKTIKQPGLLRVVSLCRIAEIKNLKFAISVVCMLKGNVSYDIYGTVDDPTYWTQCQKLIEEAPSNVIIRYKGELPHLSVAANLREYDVFLLPTMGENFGHAIFEALAAGLPVVISDKTPWRGLTAIDAGADLPLESSKAYVDVLQRYVAFDENAMLSASAAAIRRAHAKTGADGGADEYRRMFRWLLAGGLGSGTVIA